MAKNFTKNKHFIRGMIIIIIIVGGIYSYFQYNEIYPSTDDAYVKANLSTVAPKVGGFIKQLYVKNNQLVSKGQLLLTINPQDYLIAVEQAQQNYNLAQEQILNANEQVSLSTAQVLKAEADFKYNQQQKLRYANLFQQDAGSLENMQKTHNGEIQAKQDLNRAYTNLKQSKIAAQSALTQTKIAALNLKNANNNNAYTELRSPVNGYISNLDLRVGDLVGANEKLFGIVDNDEWWIDANFKETQLKRIQVGEKVKINLDMYNHQYDGMVQSISFASGNTFSLLPAENATGNWVKVTQRFTVKIKLVDNINFPLRVGASAKISINTKNQ